MLTHSRLSDKSILVIMNVSVRNVNIGIIARKAYCLRVFLLIFFFFFLPRGMLDLISLTGD